VNLSSPNDGIQDVLLNFCVTSSYMQCVTEPTRGQNILDLILINEPILLCDVFVEPPLGSSDHCQIGFKIFSGENDTSTPKIPSNTMSNWNKADFVGLTNYLSHIDWLALVSVNLTTESL